MSPRPWILVYLSLVLALAPGCGQEAPRPAELQVGPHRISVLLPDGWEHIDYGDTHQLRRELARISVEDLGWLDGDIDTAADSALVLLREDERRGEASRHHWQIDGRDAVTVDTWDRLSHEYRKRFVFVNNERSLLAISMMPGQLEAMEEAFDTLTASLSFVDSLVAPGRAGEG
jgi:hypothetical protein